MKAEWRTWPPDQNLRGEDELGAVCASCDQGWRVHRNLAGYRFRCGECGGWVDVPVPEVQTPLQLDAPGALRVAAPPVEEASLDAALQPIETMARDGSGLVQVELPAGRIYEGDIDTGLAMGAGSMRHVRNDVRQKWTNRMILEVGGMLLAILLPFLAAETLLSGDQAQALMPLSALVGGLLVVAIGFSAPQYTFGALRRAHPGYFVEGIVAAAAFVGLAMGWVALITGAGDMGDEGRRMLDGLEEIFGKGGLVLVFAVAPAIFEELAFRGLLQGRLCALSGRALGIAITAALFAMAHGFGYGTPLHIIGGLYLGFLRDRSGSLIPGMLVHGLYNGTLVLNHVA